MGISRDVLDQIKARVDALDIVREAVPTLKSAGARWKGNCPFHNERSPSFFFMPEKGLWHCFGACNEGGDVFAFVMKTQNIPFAEAVRELARRAGVPLTWEQGHDADSRRAKEREALGGLLEEASRFYTESLKTSAEGDTARRHLAERGIRPETQEKFGLGFAPRTNGFLDRALKKGVGIELLSKAGLANRSDRTGRYHDPLSGRLIFPIRDPYGQTVAFGGRVLGEDTGPKYLNSAETPVYTKGRQLYGLFEGRTALRERGQAVVVEGYMDVVGLHQAGFPVAVAPLGTALTADQARLLRRYAQEALLVFDPDPAGQRASWRSADVFLKEDVFVRVAQVPGGLDPDDFIRAQGAGALEDVLRRSQDVVDFWLDLLAPALENFSDLHGRLRRAEELLRFVAGVPNALLRDAWIKRVAERLKLDAAALRQELQKRLGRPAAAAPASAPAPKKAVPKRTVRSAEEEMLQLVGSHPEVWGTAPLEEDLFADERCRRVVRFWEDDRRAGRKIDPAGMVPLLPEGDRAWWSALLMEDKRFESPVDDFARGVGRLRGLVLARERAALEPQVIGMLEGKLPRDEQKILRYQTLTRELRTRTPDAAGRTMER